jgi:glutamine synthetase
MLLVYDTAMTDDAAAAMEQTIEAEGLDHVFVEFPDLNGIARGKQVTADEFLEKWRDGFSMNLTVLEAGALDDWDAESYYGLSTDFADGTLRPIPETFKRPPWRDDAGRVLCEFTYEGEPVEAYTRGALERVLDDLTHLDLEATAGSELEFTLLEETTDGYQPFTPYDHECVMSATEKAAPFYDILSEWAEPFGIPLTLMHHEDGAGQLEVLFDHGRPMEVADRAFDFRRLVAEAARRTEWEATFMTKPFTGAAANGYHLHVGLFRDGDNVLADAAADERRLSSTGRAFVGGVLEHAEAITALTCPTIKALKRFVPETFAPYTASWGYNNRSTAVRIPQSDPVRVETRIPAAEANPYLTTAAILAAGLHGIEEDIDPGDPGAGYVTEGRRLPRTPGLALRALEEDEVIQNALGEELIEVYLAAKRAELDAFVEEVTDWEQRYREIL